MTRFLAYNVGLYARRCDTLLYHMQHRIVRLSADSLWRVYRTLPYSNTEPDEIMLILVTLLEVLLVIDVFWNT